MKQINSSMRNKTDYVILALLSLYTYIGILDDTLLSLTSVIRFLRWGISIAGLLLFLYRNKGIPPIKKLFFSAAVLLVFSIAAKATGRTYLILYAVFIIAVEGIDSRRVVKAWVLSTVLALVTVLILCWTGVLTDYIYTYSSGRAGHCLGFSHYSSFPFLVFYCSIAFIYLLKDRVRLYHYVLAVLVNLLMYRLTTLNLTYYLTFIFLILDFLLVKLEKLDLNQKPFILLSGLLFPLGLLVTFLVTVKYNPGDARWLALNTMLHSRPGLMHQGFLRYPITLFGNPIKMLGHSALRTEAVGAYFYIDSGFAYSLFGYGLIFTFLVVALYSCIYIYSCRTNNKHLFAWLTGVLLFTMMNNTWVDVYYNPALLFSFAAFMEFDKWEGRNRVLLATIEAAGLAVIAAWLIPWLRTLGDASIGGNPQTAILTSIFMGLLLLGLAFSLGGLVLKLLSHQQPGKRRLVWTGVLMGFCVCGVLTLNGQVNRLTAQNLERLEPERLAVETVQQVADCRLLVDGPEEVYRRVFGGVSHSLYRGNSLTAVPNVAYITSVENNLQPLIRRGYKYTEISKEHAIYTNSPEAEGALMAAGYHVTGFYSHESALDLNAVSLAAFEKPIPENAALDLLAEGGVTHSIPLGLAISPYRVTVEFALSLKNEGISPEPDAVIATVKSVTTDGTRIVAEREVLYSDFDQEGHCRAALDFVNSTVENTEFLIEPAQEREEELSSLLLRGIRYRENPDYDIHSYYDASERLIWEDFYDLNGNPVTIEDGSHAREYAYDRYGYSSRIRYMDLNGNLSNNRYGYASVEQKFDSQGNPVSRRYLDEAGAPCLRTDGFSEVRWNQKEGSSVWNLELYDLTGAPVELDGINLAFANLNSGWSEWMTPQFNTDNFTFNIGSMNLGEKSAGDEYTCQIQIEFSGVTATDGQSFGFRAQGAQDGEWTAGNIWNGTVVHLMAPPADGICQFTVTSAVNEAMAEISSFDIGFRCDQWASGSFRVRSIKIEKGGVATPWSPGI